MGRLPRRPEQHEIGDAAAAAFQAAMPRAWVKNPSRSDYGWDFIVAITREGEVGAQFFAQVKGSQAVNYLADGLHLSQPLEIPTLRWLQSQPMPSMLAVCDVDAPGQPIFWIWIDEAVAQAERENPSWAEQDTLALRVPLANRLGPETHERIAVDVNRWQEALGVGLQAARVLAPGYELPGFTPIEGTPGDPALRLAVFSALQRGGLAQVISTEEGPQIEALSPEDQRRLRLLEEVKTLLDAHQDSAAQEKLNVLTPEFEQAVPGLQARYANARGVIAFRNDDRAGAVEAFRRAAILQPEDARYATNLLTAEYNAGWDAATSQRQLPEDWDRRLLDVLARSPNHVPAIRLRVLRLATTEGVENAGAYLRGSPLWEADRRDALFLLAEVYHQAKDLERALEQIELAEAVADDGDPGFWALKGEVLYVLATRDQGQESSVVYGFGPATLDVRTLQRAAEAYRVACDGLRERGYPRIAEDAVAGAASVYLLLGKAKDAEELCRSYLKRHPDARDVHTPMAMALIHQNDIGGAVSHARRALDAGPASSQRYVNLVAILVVAEEYRSAVEVIRAREQAGFQNDYEEAVSREFGAIALANLGESDLAKSQVERLRAHEGLAGRAAVAECAVMKAENAPHAAVIGLLRAEQQRRPADPMLLTALIHELLPPTAEKARELADLFERLRDVRQLAPDEMAAFGETYLLLDRPRDAAVVFESARTRYPTDLRLLFMSARALARLGDADGAYDVMRTYVGAARGDQLIYRNMGYLARETGRLDEAIDMFEQAVRRAPEDSERAELHCQLWELRRRRGDPAKQLLRHVVAYGQLTGGGPEPEARYLMLWLLTPADPAEAEDAEIGEWVRDFRRRLELFAESHPRFAGLQRIQIPEGLTEDQQRDFLFSEIAARSLPWRLRQSQVDLVIRGAPWPLTTRKSFLVGSGSVFRYWERCTRSDRYADSIHIHEPPLRVEEEVRNVPLGGRVCIDLIALLTLRLLDLLDDLGDVFAEIIIPRGVARAVRNEFIGIDEPHNAAERLRDWLRTNRRAVRVQAADGVSDRASQSGSYRLFGPLWLADEPNVAELVPDGVGEALLLARQLGIPLYSDETTVRRWARDDYGMNSFSTVALLAALRHSSRVTPENETRCLVRLIGRNYRKVPFTWQHLQTRLTAILPGAGAAEVEADEVLGPLLTEFGNTEREEVELIEVGVRWWMAMLRTQALPADVFHRIVQRVTFALGQRGGDVDVRTATIWGTWLLEAYRAGDLAGVGRAWNIIAACGEEMMPGDEGRYRRIMFRLVPDALYEMLGSSLGNDGRDRAIISFAGQLPPGAADRLFYCMARARRR